MNRREFLSVCARAAALAAAASAAPGVAWASLPQKSQLKFYNLHTEEKARITYRVGNHYNPQALNQINHILRDHRNNAVHDIDTELLDLLDRLGHKLGYNGYFHVISGYRSPETNAMLRKHSSGVAKRSLHLEGRAIDIRLPGVPLHTLRDTAIALKRGGVGYYPESEFVHVDVGRVRTW